MPKNRLLLWTAFLLTGGCGRPAKEAVFVDVDRVVQTTPADNYPADTGPTHGDAIVASTVQVPGLPETSLHGSRGVDESDARATLEANRKKAQRQLEDRLRNVYYDELRKQQETALDEIDPSLAPKFAEAQAQRKAIFDAYATDRGAKMAQLTLLVGFPDPDPNASSPIRETATELAKSRRQKADGLRADIKELDKKYDHDVAVILRQIDAERDKNLTAIQERFSKARTDADARAKQEAATEMAALREEFGVALSAPRDIHLPAIPPKAVTSPRLAQASAAPLPTPATSPEETRKLLEDQIKIWRAVKGYREGKTSRTARDGTEEFLEWRKSRLLGPSAN
jgi:hypothetical protein